MSRLRDGDERLDVPTDTKETSSGGDLAPADNGWAEAVADLRARDTGAEAEDRIDTARRAVDDAYLADPGTAESQTRLAEARSQVDVVFAEEDARLGSSSDDFRKKALDKFDLDPESTRRATELGRLLADEMPVASWEVADYASRHQATVDLGLDLSRQLDIPPNIPNVDPDMPIDQLGTSQGDLVRLNGRLLDNPDPTDMIETIAHEYRHQWQDGVINGKIEHPVGDSELYNLVSADISYPSDRLRDAKYASNYCEVDAEAFARAVSKAYNDQRWT
jgi:hypothetical protein